MRLNSKVGGILVVVLLVHIFYIEGFSEVFVTTDPSDQYDPAIYDNFVVWTDTRNGNKDIYGYNLSGGVEFQITTDENDQSEPAIHGDIVVWTDTRNGNKDIYGYNLSEEKEFQITTDENDQSDPALYNGIIVWTDYRNGNKDIYGYNLLTEKEFQITTDENDQQNPAIYRDIIVWTDYRNGNEDIYGYNLLTEREFQITMNTSVQTNPAICGNIVVWTDTRNGNKDIHGYNLSGGVEFQMTTDENDQQNPAIHGDTIVWKDNRNGNWDIYGHKLSTEEEFQITTDENDQSEPAIYGNLVVWTDTRNENENILGYDLLAEFPLIIWIDRGYSGEYFVGDMLKVHWIASQGGITFWVKDTDGKTLDKLGEVSGSGQGSRGWTLKEEYGYGKKSIYAEVGSNSAECEFYIVRKVANIEVKVRDHNGEPIPEVDVLLDDGFRGKTDSSGIYVIQDVEFGEHVITVEFEEIDDRTRIRVESTETQDVDFSFSLPADERGTIQVHVFDQDGNPVKECDVYIDEFLKGQTSEEGVFMISASEGSHPVKARWQGEEAEESVIVEKNQTTSVELTIPISSTDLSILLYAVPALLATIVAAMLIWKRKPKEKEIKEKKVKEKPHVLICPQCKNRIKKDWDTCPYCKAKLK